MSLILEALKKSEAERGGRPPAGGDADAASRRSGRGVAGAMAAIALLGGIAGWWGSRHWAARSPPTAPTAEVKPRAGTPEEVATTAGVTVTDAAPPVEPGSGIVEDAGGAAGEPAADEDTVRQPSAAPDIPSTGPPPPRLVTVTAPPAAIAAGSERAAAPPAPATESPRPDTREAASTGDLPRVDQLPSLRAEFGKLELNMLVYATRPEARFALINLERFKEGEQIRPGLELREIRRDGAVLSLRGQSVLLPSGH